MLMQDQRRIKSPQAARGHAMVIVHCTYAIIEIRDITKNEFRNSHEICVDLLACSFRDPT
jgi:hypothetical protein